MKTIVLAIMSLALSSCATMSFDSLWSADSIGKLKCEQVVLDKQIQGAINSQTEAEEIFENVVDRRS